MTGLDALAYTADAAIIGTYLGTATRRLDRRTFHWANALGAPPIIATEIIVGAWQALILTAMFGVAGLIGVAVDR